MVLVFLMQQMGYQSESEICKKLSDLDCGYYGSCSNNNSKGEIGAQDFNITWDANDTVE
jgi:hypothetical protein